MSRCRTAALGGHKDKCVNCQFEAPISYNSCRSRCCTVQQARRRWLEAQQRDLLNTNYFHVVFTLPHQLNPLALTTPKLFFDLLFSASSQTLLEVGSDPKRLGARSDSSPSCIHGVKTCSAIIMSTRSFPPADCRQIIERWIPTSHPLFLVPIPTLRTVFREKFLAGLRQLYRKDMLDLTGPAAAFRDHASFEQLMEKLGKKNWFVYAKPPFGGAEHVLRYLGRYTHRMAIRQPPPDSLRRRARRLPLAVVPTAASSASCPSTPRGVPAPLFPARFAQGFRAHPPALACSRTASANNCCPWRAHSSPPRATSHSLCRPCPTANSGTAPVAAHPCASPSASPPLNSISQASIPHDDRYQPGLWTCSRHAIPLVCPTAVSALSLCRRWYPREASIQGNLSGKRPTSIVIADQGFLTHLPGPRTVFKIHNPRPDHRARGKRLRLPSYLQIESASHLHLNTSYPARGASDLG